MTDLPLSDVCDLPNWCWNELDAAATHRDHPWTTAVLATVSADGPEARTVVMRSTDRDRRSIWFHTDRRSAKVQELEANPAVLWTFWNPEQRVQLRCRGTAMLAPSPAETEHQWSMLGSSSQSLYWLSEPPGSALGEHGAPWPAPSAPGSEDEAAARDRFLPVRCELDRMDWLQLGRHRHHRALLEWAPDGWQARAIAP